jgi:hypothetical protein
MIGRAVKLLVGTGCSGPNNAKHSEREMRYGSRKIGFAVRHDIPDSIDPSLDRRVAVRLTPFIFGQQSNSEKSEMYPQLALLSY